MNIQTSNSPTNVFPGLETIPSDRLVHQEHPRYESSRAVWNGRVDRRPAVIVHAENVEDVQSAVKYAASVDLPLAVRGQGHSVAGHGVCDGGVVVDLSAMKNLEIDQTAQTARAEPGLTLGEFLDQIEAFGLITTVGSHSVVGLAGFTLCGGIGLLMSRYGLGSDNLIAAEIVTADGNVHKVSATENSDLFWAIRGGGGNFGIVTSLTYQLHKAEPMLAGPVIHPAPRYRALLTAYRAFTETAPDELGLFAGFVTAPNGHPAAIMLSCYTGSPEKAEQVLAPIRQFGPPVADLVRPTPYSPILHSLDNQEPRGHHYSYFSRGIPVLTDDLLDIIADFALRRTSPGTAVILYHQHGAVTEKPDDATAYSGRHLPYLIGVYSGWNDVDESKHIEWLTTFKSALFPFTTAPGCISLVSEDGIDEVRENYGANYAKLQKIKTSWDPTNLFRNNHNIPPAKQNTDLGSSPLLHLIGLAKNGSTDSSEHHDFKTGDDITGGI